MPLLLSQRSVDSIWVVCFLAINCMSLIYLSILLSVLYCLNYWCVVSLKSVLVLWFSYSFVKVKSLSHVQLFATPWTVACQAPSSVGFSRQEYWSGLPFPSLGDFPDPGIEPRSLALQVDTLTPELPGKPFFHSIMLFWIFCPSIWIWNQFADIHKITFWNLDLDVVVYRVTWGGLAP